MEGDDALKRGRPSFDVGSAPNLSFPQASASAESHFRYRVHLLGGFRAMDGATAIDLPPSTWRLVAFLAIAGRPVERGYVANSLWMDKSEDRAQANLRSCLWRLRQANSSLVGYTQTRLCIRDEVRVDHQELVRFARTLADEDAEVDLNAVEAEWFCAELLPDWYDDFVETEREPFRQLRLHALEALAQRLQRAGRTNRALDVALTAVAASPLRETAHRLVIAIHLDEGNVAEALGQYRTLCKLLRTKLGVGPSPSVRLLIAPWLTAVNRAGPLPERPGAAPRRPAGIGSVQGPISLQ
jgi:DNA-binding SARP family transcriptional activator